MKPLAARLAPIAALALALLLPACGDEEAGSGGSEHVTVVATTTQVADLVRTVAGERAAVRQILQPGSDPHGYEPRPSDIEAVSEAGAIFRSGGDVDEWMDEIADQAGGDATQVTLIDHVGARSGDPHWWHDPRNAQRAVRVIRGELVRLDPAGRAGYERNAAAYLDALEHLDRETAACIEKLPESKRKLVTTHDALGPYADRYGLEVIGAVIPSLSTQAQPSAGDIDALVRQIRENDVAAIFPESSLNAKLEEAVARESGAVAGEPLWADTLGPEGSSGATYVDSIAANTAAIVSGLSGGEIDCRPTA